MKKVLIAILTIGSCIPAYAKSPINGVSAVEPITEQRWGRLTRLRLPGGDEIGLYEPRHAQPGASRHNQDA